MQREIHYISPEKLTYPIIEQILEGHKMLALSYESVALIQKSKAYLDRKINETHGPMYGINTGFGALCNIEVSKDDLSKLQENLVISHACNLGPEIPSDVVRLMLLLKAHALSKGNSAVQLITVQRILDLYNNDILSIVCEQGSLGASGDLAPLAKLFLQLIGMGEVYHHGIRKDACDVLKEMGWERLKLQAKEGLALLNGTQFMSAHAVFNLLKAFRLLDYADIIGAL